MTQTWLVEDLLHPSNEWSTEETMVQDGESLMVPGALRVVCSLAEKAPGDGKQIAFPRKGTRQIYLLFCREKNTRHKFNWLIKARRNDLNVNWQRVHKTNAGTCLDCVACVALSARCHIFKNVLYYWKTTCFTVAILYPGQRLMEH